MTHGGAEVIGVHRVVISRQGENGFGVACYCGNPKDEGRSFVMYGLALSEGVDDPQIVAMHAYRVLRLVDIKLNGKRTIDEFQELPKLVALQPGISIEFDCVTKGK